MLNFAEFESENYDFYRFSRLVVDVLIVPNNFFIPYDIELEIIYKAYSKFEYSQDVESPYDEQLEYISSNRELLLKLQAVNEGYWFNQPTKFYLNTKGNTLCQTLL